MEPVEARLVTESDGTRRWKGNVSENVMPEIVKEFVEFGMDRKDIIRELKDVYGKSTATAYRLTEKYFPKK